MTRREAPGLINSLSVLNLYTRIDRSVFRTLPPGYARAAYMKANFLLFRKLRMIWPVAVKTLHDFRMIVDKVDRVAGYIYFFGVWEPQISTIITHLLDPGDTFLDIGAHIGHHTLLAARAVGDLGRVYAFEASPQTFKTLKANIALNGFTNVEAKNAAVCTKDGTVPLLIASHENSLRNSLVHAQEQQDTIDVPACRLDDLVDRIPCSTVKLIKIDAEGAEAEVLAGAHALLTKIPRDVAILVELQEGIATEGASSRQVLDFLQGQGFQAFSVNNDYSAANYDAPLRLTPVLKPGDHSLMDILLVRGCLLDRISEFIIADRPG